MKKLWTMTDEEHKTMVTREKYDKLQQKLDDNTEIVMDMAKRSKYGCLRRSSDQKNVRGYCEGCKFIRICGCKHKKFEPQGWGQNEGGHM